MHRAGETLARWYNTSIMGFYFGTVPCMLVLDLDTTKEVLNNPDMDGRPIFPMVRARDPFFGVFGETFFIAFWVTKFQFLHSSTGIFFRDDEFWRNQRRFTLRYLRDFGFGRRFDELEIHIDEELRAFVELIKGGAKFDYEKKLVTEDGLVSVPHIFSGHPANLFLKCVVNERFDRKELQSVFE